MSRLISIIFFFILFYYLFKLVARVVLPWLLKSQINKMAQRQSNAYQKTQQEYKKKEGEVTVHYQPNGDKKGNSSSNGGDYVDFEEIKE